MQLIKRVVNLICLVLVLGVLLSGCSKANLGVDVLADGGGTIRTEILIEKSVYEKAIEGGKRIEGVGLLEKSDTLVDVDGVLYVMLAETNSYGTYEDMEKALLEMKHLAAYINGVKVGGSPLTVGAPPESPSAVSLGLFSGVELTKTDGEVGTQYEFKATINAQKLEGYNINEAVKFRFDISLPVGISESLGGVVNGNTLTCFISDLTVETEIQATGLLPKEETTVPAVTESSSAETEVDTKPAIAWEWLVLAGLLSVLLVFCLVALFKVIVRLRARR